MCCHFDFCLFSVFLRNNSPCTGLESRYLRSMNRFQRTTYWILKYHWNISKYPPGKPNGKRKHHHLQKKCLSFSNGKHPTLCSSMIHCKFDLGMKFGLGIYIHLYGIHIVNIIYVNIYIYIFFYWYTYENQRISRPVSIYKYVYRILIWRYIYIFILFIYVSIYIYHHVNIWEMYPSKRCFFFGGTINWASVLYCS